MLKLVLDTNVLIDASEDSYRYANRIIDLVIAGQVQAFANAQTLRENKFLASKKITDEGYLKKLNYFFEQVNAVESQRLNIVEDPEDNKILESAVASQADFLITSDKHLLKLEKFSARGGSAFGGKVIKIIRPNQFWSIWEEEDEGWLKWIKSFINQ